MLRVCRARDPSEGTPSFEGASVGHWAPTASSREPPPDLSATNLALVRLLLYINEKVETQSCPCATHTTANQHEHHTTAATSTAHPPQLAHGGTGQSHTKHITALQKRETRQREQQARGEVTQARAEGISHDVWVGVRKLVRTQRANKARWAATSFSQPTAQQVLAQIFETPARRGRQHH